MDGVGEAERRRQEKKGEKEMEVARANMEGGGEGTKLEGENIFAKLLDGVGEAEERRQGKERVGLVEAVKNEVQVGVEVVSLGDGQRQGQGHEEHEGGKSKIDQVDDQGVRKDKKIGVEKRLERKKDKEDEDMAVKSESALQRIAMGYGDDGELGGEYGKENPPPGYKFGGYREDHLCVTWMPLN